MIFPFSPLVFVPINSLMAEMQDTNQYLLGLAKTEQLFALVDPYFQLPFEVPKQRLDIRDTDTEIFEMIAWEKVFYQPPYLVQVTEEAYRWFAHSLSTERWGIFVVAKASLTQLGQHLQKFVITKGPDGSPYFLRFHDAAVLETLLEMWPEQNRNMFLGPISALGIPSLDDLEVQIIKSPVVNDMQFLTHQKPEECLLKLTAEQLKRCTEAIEKDLVKLIYWHLRTYHPKAVGYIDKATLYVRIDQGLMRARTYELSSIADLAGFVALMFELTPHFDEHPSFAKVLNDPSLPSEQKLRKLSQVITDREWQEAMRLQKKTAWSDVRKRPA